MKEIQLAFFAIPVFYMCLAYADSTPNEQNGDGGSVFTVEIQLTDTLNNKEIIITYDNLIKIKKKILEKGKTQTYCNMFNNNPFDETRSYNYYLNPDTGQKNINCIKGMSDFNYLAARTKNITRDQYIEFDFKNKDVVRIIVPWPEDKLSVKDIKSFARKAIKEYLNI